MIGPIGRRGKSVLRRHPPPLLHVTRECCSESDSIRNSCPGYDAIVDNDNVLCTDGSTTVVVVGPIGAVSAEVSRRLAG